MTTSGSKNTIPDRRPVFFGWYIVSAGFILLSLGYGARYSFSVFFPTLALEMDWPRDLAASILSFHLMAYGCTAPFAGFLVDRIGPRRTMLCGTVLLATGLFLSGLAARPWHFFLTFGLVAGVGLCLLASVPLTVLLRNWFERKRGTAIALCFLGEGAAYAWFPAVVWIIDLLGWRRAMGLEGLVVAAVFTPLILAVMVANPGLKGQTRDGLDSGSRSSARTARLEKARIVDPVWAARDWSLGRAIKSGRFYLICVSSFAIWGLAHHIMVTHQIAFAVDMGHSRLYASAVMSLGGPAFCVGCLVSLASDRFGREWPITVGSLLAIVGILALLLVEGAGRPWLLHFYAIFFGIGFGMCVPLVAASTTDIFQGPGAGATIGAVWFCFAMGGALGPWLGGWLFEYFGNYDAAFIVAAVAQAAGCLAVWLAAPRKVRLAPGLIRADESPGRA